MSSSDTDMDACLGCMTKEPEIRIWAWPRGGPRTEFLYLAPRRKSAGSTQRDFSGAQTWGQASVTPSDFTSVTSLSGSPGRTGQG